MTATDLPPLFPLVRHASGRLTPFLLRMPWSANQITTASLLAGIAAAVLLLSGAWQHQIASGVALVVCYVLDNCDGEVARIKNQASTFGYYYDTAVDWVVHTAFFIALGAGMSTRTGADWWFHAGLVAGAGGTINYFLGLYLDVRDAREQPTSRAAAEQDTAPRGALEWVLFVFRELTRADFCFLVVLLAIADLLWFLLPAGAIGAQVYWMTLCIKRVRRFHV